MKYQFAQVSGVMEERLRDVLSQSKAGELCVPGAIRLMFCGKGVMPRAVFVSDEEIRILEENGYDRDSDPFMLHKAVVLVVEPSRGQVKQRGIYEQGNLFELRR